MLRTIKTRQSRQLFTLALPLMVQALLASSMSFVDALMVGQLGEQVIAALGNAIQLILFCHILLAAIEGGGAVLLAQYHGSGQNRKLGSLLSSLCLVGVVCGLLIAILFINAGEWLASILTLEMWQAPQHGLAVAPLTGNYLSIIGWSMPFVVVGAILSCAFQSTGDTRTPVKISIAFNLLNIIGNWLLIFGAAIPGVSEPLFTPMGYIGAAISTAVTGSGASIVILWLAASKKRPWHGTLHRPSFAALGKVFHIGLPMSVDGFFWQSARVFYTLVMNAIGAKAFAVYVIVRTLKALLMLPMEGLNSASQILIGQILGKGKFQRAKIASKHSIQLVLLVTTLPVAAILIGADLFLQLYEIAPDTAENARICIYILAISLYATAINSVVPAILTSGGDTYSSMNITLACFLLVGAPSAWLLGITFEYGLIGAFIGISLEEIAKAVVFIWRLNQQRWLVKLA
ncbi:MATE family efflux transporter [Corallincola luteus]|uniref:Multidrug-efflux transporter n=1 Tax=Corallincola luteus TaxID=1775177 RepID=A0ABY2AHD6_9GAMM|nr:MATE family efflux transporter [Corallincola luteus]TCI02022.1 MATE family efflux transporter [Corallincola luteus]